MDKVLYFNSGDGEDSSDESCAFPLSSFRGFVCRSATAITVCFTSTKDSHQDTTAGGQDMITLTITSGAHRQVIKELSNIFYNNDQTFIVVADKDNEIYAVSDITDVGIVISS